MHLALLTPEWFEDDGGGGIATYSRILAARAAALGHDVTVLAASVRERAREGSVHPLFVPRGATALEIATAFRDAWRRLPDVDAIEAPEFGAVASLIVGEAPVVTRLHTPLALLLERNEGSPIYRDDDLRCELEARQVRGSALVTSPTAWLAREAMRLWNLAGEPIVIPNPVERPAGVPATRAASHPLRVLYFGRLEHRKGVLTLAAAARPLIAHGAIELTLAGGDTKWRGRSVRAQLEETLAPFTARILPPQHGAALTALIDEADLVVLPSLFENFAYACVEAMTRAKCVLATTGSGFEEILEQGRTGILVAPGDAGALSAAISRCAEGAYDLRKIGRAAFDSLARFNAAATTPAHLLDSAP